MRTIQRFVWGALLAVGSGLSWAVEPPTAPVAVDIARQPLRAALAAFAEQTGLQVMLREEGVEAERQIASSVKGTLSPQEVLARLLETTNLQYEFVTEKMIRISERETPSTSGLSSARTGEEAGGETFRLAQNTLPVAHSQKEPSGAAAGVASGEGSPVELSEIVVTAQKRAERLQDVPISIVALGGADLEARGIRDLKELSYAVPGLYVQDSGANNRRVSIRGIGNIFGNSPTVGVYLDEVPLSTGNAEQIDVQAYDMERVEVLRGPQGTLYGQGSMGGTIRYITADPHLQRMVGTADGDYAFTDDGDPLQRVRGVISVPLVADKLAIRLAALYEDAGGWIDQPTLNKRNINGHQLFSARAKLLWAPTDALEVRTMAMFRRNQTGSGTGVDRDGNFQQVLGIASTPAIDDAYDVYNLTVSYDFGGVKVLNTASYKQIKYFQRNLSGQCCYLDDMYQYVSDYRYKNFYFAEELRLSSSDSARLQWTVGGMYENRQGHAYAGYPATVGFESTGPLESFDTEYWGSDGSAWAVFGDVSYALSDNFKLGIGLRRYEDEQEEGTFKATSPKVYLSYALNDRVNLYASAARGFRSGGFNGGSAPPFLPENLWSYELGTKMSSADRRIRAELALVRSDYKDYQIAGVDIENIQYGNIISNAGDVRIYSLDGLVAVKPLDGLEMGISGSYLYTKFVKVAVVESSHWVGDNLDLVADYSVSLYGEYQFVWPGSSGAQGSLRVDVNQQGPATYRIRSLDPTRYFSESGTISLLNAQMGWSRNAWWAELYGRNLLNEDEFDGPIEIERNATRPWPRTFGVQVGYRFD